MVELQTSRLARSAGRYGALCVLVLSLPFHDGWGDPQCVLHSRLRTGRRTTGCLIAGLPRSETERHMIGCQA